ncbi:B-cell lymphoma 3 homolog isoform X1 [Paramuricea clavata]|uniref:B-cell lymphoma 3 homolog isoform X1 n=1 Tax=Paramuricea clavata TaxID=317549 RepID=A0A6S7JF17_PARCT|nr:B-cell lymphoma 3 homolog isoform X1 [Paramuricea clavata]
MESTDTHTDREKSELERTNRCETISDQTSLEQGDYSGITVEISDHSSRKRRTVHQLSDEDISTHEKKRNYELEASVQSLVLQQKETTFDTEKQQDDLKQTSPHRHIHRHRPRPSNTSPKKGLLQRQQGQEAEIKQATCQTKDKADIKSSSSSEIATTATGKQSNPVLENLVQTLLKYPSLFQKDEDGDTILHLAIVHKNINLTFATILAMVRRKQENNKVKGIDIQNELLQTPLHLAVLTCQPSIVEYLMLHEADVNAIDRNGQTALHLACKNADVEDIHALRKITPKDSEKSINVDLKNFEGNKVKNYGYIYIYVTC